MYAVGGGDFGEVTVRAAVDVGDGDDMGARGEGLEDGGGCGGAGREGESILCVLERCYCGFEVCSVWVRGSRVLIFANGLAYP